jgi:hypothetical protein
MQRHGQFNRAKPGGEVSAGAAHAVEQVATQFIAQLRQALFWQRTQFRSGIDKCQGRVFGYIKTHQRLIVLLVIHWAMFLPFGNPDDSERIVYLSRWIM